MHSVGRFGLERQVVVGGFAVRVWRGRCERLVLEVVAANLRAVLGFDQRGQIAQYFKEHMGGLVVEVGRQQYGEWVGVVVFH